MESGVDIGFAHAPIGLVVTRFRVVQRCNIRFGEMFGFEGEQLEGQSLSKLYPSLKDFYHIGDKGQKILRDSGSYINERIMKRGNGELFWCRVRGQSLTPENPFAHAVWSFADLAESRPVVELSARERQVAILVTEGLTSKEIANSLDISPRTIEAHRARLLQKFGVRNSAELIARLTGIQL